MRIRRKKNTEERIAACARLIIDEPERMKNNPAVPFETKGPIHLEIGCGKGAFACGMAAANPDINYIALERIKDVACAALERAEMEMMLRPTDNLRFIITDAQNIENWLPEGSIECIYLNFSDPWPKSRHTKRRLTHPEYLKLYRKLIINGGHLVLKTDNTGFFDFSLEQFAAAGFDIVWQTRDLAQSERAERNVMTEYERNFTMRGMKICLADVIFN